MIINKKVCPLTVDYLSGFSVYVILFQLISCNSLGEDSSFDENLEFSKTLSSLNCDSFYLAFRSGGTTESQMAIWYNVSDTTFSHVGLLLHKKSGWW